MILLVTFHPISHAAGDEGPDICLDNVEDSYNCTDNFTCGDDDFCTSPCHCWTGDELRDDDVAAFTGVSVEQQG